MPLPLHVLKTTVPLLTKKKFTVDAASVEKGWPALLLVNTYNNTRNPAVNEMTSAM